MTRPLVIWALWITMSGAAFPQADEPWNDKPWTEWTVDDTARILQDSPWAQIVDFGSSVMSAESAARREGYTGTSPGRVLRGIGDPVYLPGTPTVSAPRPTVSRRSGPTLLVQWFSSLTIRQALVREKGLSPEKAREFLEARPLEHVILVHGLDVEQLDEQTLIQSASLRTETATVKVHPVTVVKQGQMVWFAFPREISGKPLLEPDGGKVKFEWNPVISSGEKRDKEDSKAGNSFMPKFEATFHIQKMMRNDGLDV